MKYGRLFLMALAVILVVSIAMAEYFNTVYISNQLVLKANANLDAAGSGVYFEGNSLLRTSGTFTAAEKIDTTVISGLLSTDYVVASPVFTAAADTTGFKTLWTRVVNDTLFTYQTSTAALRAVAWRAVIWR